MKNFKSMLLIAAACASLSVINFAQATDGTTTTTTAASDNNTPGQETTGQYVDNSALTLKVKAKLMADNMVKSLPITVTSYKGVVELSGFVDSKQQIQDAIRVAKSVDGVQEVKNALVVKH